MTVTYETRFGPGYVAEPMFEGMYFPAGEAHIKLLADKERNDVGPLVQYARVNSADGNDLFEVAMWADAVNNRNEKAVLEIPYLPGARADHPEELVYGARVYAEFLNSLKVDHIVCFDSHSMVMPSMLHKWSMIPSTALVRHYIVGKADVGGPQRYQGIIAPDKGAVKRASQVAKACHLPLYKAEKHRDPDTGKLSGFSCEPLPETGKFLVVDDICDGGGTFMGLAEATGLPIERLGLYVSHGVFSGNAQNLFAYYDEIWTTDSLDTAERFIFDAEIKLENPLRANLIPLARTLKGYSA